MQGVGHDNVIGASLELPGDEGDPAAYGLDAVPGDLAVLDEREGVDFARHHRRQDPVRPARDQVRKAVVIYFPGLAEGSLHQRECALRQVNRLRHRSFLRRREALSRSVWLSTENSPVFDALNFPRSCLEGAGLGGEPSHLIFADLTYRHGTFKAAQIAGIVRGNAAGLVTDFGDFIERDAGFGLLT
jgi:hypothetical protein